MLPFSTPSVTNNLGFEPSRLEFWRIAKYYYDFRVCQGGTVRCSQQSPTVVNW